MSGVTNRPPRNDTFGTLPNFTLYCRGRSLMKTQCHIKKRWQFENLVCRLQVQLMRASTPFGGGKCHTPFHKECPRPHGPKGDPRVTPKICGTVGERGQVILVWVTPMCVGNVFHPRRQGVMRVSLWAMRSSWLRIIECSRTTQAEVWARKYGNVNGAFPKESALEQKWFGSKVPGLPKFKQT